MFKNLAEASLTLSELELQLATDEYTVDVQWFRAMTVDGEWEIKRHMHSGFEFHFIAKGVCQVILDKGSFVAHAGEFYLTGPGVYHKQCADNPEELIEYSLYCDIRLLGESQSEFYHLLRSLRNAACAPVEGSELIAIFEQALAEAEERRLGFYALIRGYCMQLLCLSARLLSAQNGTSYSIPLKKQKDHYLFIQIFNFAQDNALSALTPGDIATQLYLSEKQVYRAVRQARGISTKELIEQIRFQKAKQLLRETDYSIKQIAQLMNFSSEYYFSQFFKRRESVPPGHYRTSVRTVW